MLDWLRWVIIATALLLALLAYVDFRGTHAPRRPSLVLAIVTEVAVLVQVVVAAIAMISGDRPGELATFIGYLVTTLLIIPFAWYFMLVERTKWAAVVFAVAGVTDAVLMVRLDQLWMT